MKGDSEDASEYVRSPGVVYAATVAASLEDFHPDPDGRVWDESRTLVPFAMALVEQVRQFLEGLRTWPDYPRSVANADDELRLEFVLQRAEDRGWDWWGDPRSAFEDVSPQDLFRYVLDLRKFSGRYHAAWDFRGLQLFVGEALPSLGDFPGDSGERHSPHVLQVLLELVGDLTTELGHIVAFLESLDEQD